MIRFSQLKPVLRYPRAWRYKDKQQTDCSGVRHSMKFLELTYGTHNVYTTSEGYTHAGIKSCLGTKWVTHCVPGLKEECIIDLLFSWLKLDLVRFHHSLSELQQLWAHLFLRPTQHKARDNGVQTLHTQRLCTAARKRRTEYEALILESLSEEQQVNPREGTGHFVCTWCYICDKWSQACSVLPFA